MIDSLASQRSLYGFREFSEARPRERNRANAATWTPRRMREDPPSQCQTGNQPPATSKASPEKEDAMFARAKPSQHLRALPSNCYRYVRSFCIIGAPVSGRPCQVEIRFREAWRRGEEEGTIARADASFSSRELWPRVETPRRGAKSILPTAIFKLRALSSSDKAQIAGLRTKCECIHAR